MLRDSSEEEDQDGERYPGGGMGSQSVRLKNILPISRENSSFS